MEININVDWGKALDGLDKHTINRAVDQGLKRAAIYTESQAKKNMSSHVVTGKARAGITHRVAGGAAYIGSADPVLRFLEEGTRPHVIRPRNKKALAWPNAGFSAAGLGHGPQGTLKASGSLTVRKKVNHPGTDAYHILEGTLKSETGSIVNIFTQSIKTFIL